MSHGCKFANWDILYIFFSMTKFVVSDAFYILEIDNSTNYKFIKVINYIKP